MGEKEKKSLNLSAALLCNWNEVAGTANALAFFSSVQLLVQILREQMELPAKNYLSLHYSCLGIDTKIWTYRPEFLARL